MINATSTTSYFKQPLPSEVTSSGDSLNSYTPPNQPKKIFGFELRALLTVLGLTAFFLLAMTGVLIAIRQRVSQGPVTPNAPASKPKADVVQTATCSLSFTVAAVIPSPSPSPSPSATTTITTCTKQTYEDALNVTASEYQTRITNNQYQLVSKTSFRPNDNILFVITPTSNNNTVTFNFTDALNTGNLNQYLEFVDSSCGSVAYNTTTKTLTCTNVASTAKVYFRAKVASGTPHNTTLTNVANFTAGGNNGTCEVSVNVTNYACNTACTSDSQCQTVNGAYVCASDQGNRCRLDSYRSADNCTPPETQYTCDSPCGLNGSNGNEQCGKIGSNYTCYENRCRHTSYPTRSNCLPPDYVPPTPAPGCNDRCSTPADCSNPAHTCVTTADGSNRCRLAEYVNSDTCTKPVYTTNVPTKVVSPVPPEQTTTELPKTGALSNALLFGLAAAGIGLLGLLFL